MYVCMYVFVEVPAPPGISSVELNCQDLCDGVLPMLERSHGRCNTLPEDLPNMATPRSCPRVFRIQVALPGVSSVARTHLADSTLTLLEGDKRHKPEKWPEGLPFEEQARRSATWELGFLSQVFLLRVVYL